MVLDSKTLVRICCELDSGIEVCKDSLLLCSSGLPVLCLAYGGPKQANFLSPHLWSCNRVDNVVA